MSHVCSVPSFCIKPLWLEISRYTCNSTSLGTSQATLKTWEEPWVEAKCEVLSRHHYNSYSEVHQPSGFEGSQGTGDLNHNADFPAAINSQTSDGKCEVTGGPSFADHSNIQNRVGSPTREHNSGLQYTREVANEQATVISSHDVKEACDLSTDEEVTTCNAHLTVRPHLVNHHEESYTPNASLCCCISGEKRASYPSTLVPLKQAKPLHMDFVCPSKTVLVHTN